MLQTMDFHRFCYGWISISIFYMLMIARFGEAIETFEITKDDPHQFTLGGKIRRSVDRDNASTSCIKSTLIPVGFHYLAIPCALTKDEDPENIEEIVYNKWELPRTVRANDVAFSKQGTAIVKIVNQRLSGPAECQLSYGQHKQTFHHHILAYDMPKYRFLAKLAFSVHLCSLNDEDVQAKIKLIKDVACPTNDKLCERKVEGVCEHDYLLVVDVYGRKVPVKTKGTCGIECGSTRAIAKATSNMDFLLQELNGSHLKDSGSTKLVYNKEKTKASVNVICEDGYKFNDQLNYCLPCPPGEFSVDGSKCEQCPIGEYQNEYGKHACTVCPSGSTLSYSGAKSKNECKSKQVKIGEDLPPSCEYWDKEKADKYVSHKNKATLRGKKHKMKQQKLKRLIKKYKKFYRKQSHAKRTSVMKILKKRVESLKKRILSLGGKVPDLSNKDSSNKKTTVSSQNIDRYIKVTYDIAEMKKKISTLTNTLSEWVKDGKDVSKYTEQQRNTITKAYKMVNKKLGKVRRMLKRTESKKKLAKRVKYLRKIHKGTKAVERGLEDMKIMMSKMVEIATVSVTVAKDSGLKSSGRKTNVLDQVKTKELRGRVIRYEKARKGLIAAIKKWKDARKYLRNAVNLDTQMKKKLQRNMIQLGKNLKFPISKLNKLTNIGIPEQYKKLVKMEKIIRSVSKRLDRTNEIITKYNHSTTTAPTSTTTEEVTTTIHPLMKDSGLETETTEKSSWEKQLDGEVNHSEKEDIQELLGKIDETSEDSEIEVTEAPTTTSGSLNDMRKWIAPIVLLVALIATIIIAVVIWHFAKSKQNRQLDQQDSRTSLVQNSLVSGATFMTSERSLKTPYGQLM